MSCKIYILDFDYNEVYLVLSKSKEIQNNLTINTLIATLESTKLVLLIKN